ncbi:MAG: ATP-dependent zinc metalloprotease FtsH [Actinomycetota bacterium]|nr:ATP-dependent zinc metalloprotease FtsH [Actinomycetota bacterium]
MRNEAPGGFPAWRRKIARNFKQYRIRRRRKRHTGKRTTGRRSTIVLGLILLVLFGAFAWSQTYLDPQSPGQELTFDELDALAKENRIVSAEFRDEDAQLVGTFQAEPVVEKEEPKKPADKADDAKADDAKAGDDAGAQDGSDGEDAEGSGPQAAGEGTEGDAAEGDKDQPAAEGDEAKKPAAGGATETEEESKAPPGDGEFFVTLPQNGAAFGPLVDTLTAAGASVSVEPQTAKAVVRVISQFLLPLLILAAFFGLLFTAGRGGGSGIGDVMQFGSIGKGKSKRGAGGMVTYEDVGGAEEAVLELSEVVDYLTNPDRYEEIGAVPPKGVLLFGPPGCGKTLIARATAGEAGVPFFSVAGAEFVESLVGVGAARVRDLFARVRAVAPAIVFIDELDAAGRKRGAGGSGGGGSDEREQTLNQLLVEMDGFEVSAGIVVIGATNRPDILDPALLRPGRFDRHITVDQPDHDGRKEILLLHAKGKPMASSVDFDYLAKRTPGFSGADLANVINEAALLSLRSAKPEIETPDLEEAIQRVLHGPKRRGKVLSEEERGRASYHESAHAIVSAALGRGDDVHRVTILARSKNVASMGIESEDDSTLLTRYQLTRQLVTAMSGLAAEEMIFGEPSTGSESDLERATEIARDMVGRFGMSPKLGRARLLAPDAEVYLGGDTGIAQLSDPTHTEMDAEIGRILHAAEVEATRLLEVNIDILHRMAERLKELETLEGVPLHRILREVKAGELHMSGLFTRSGSNGAKAGTGTRARRAPAAKTAATKAPVPKGDPGET